jgi:hypothetical protein
VVRRSCPALILLAVLALVPMPSRADGPLGADDWKYDVVYRKGGKPLVGLVLEQTATHVIIRCVSRKPGSPTVVIRDVLPLKEVDRVDLLGPQEREVLRERLENLRKERENLAAQLKLLEPGMRSPDPAGSDHVTLTQTEWVQKGRPPAQAYQGTHFRLISNSRDEVIQLVATQLEQVYAAYAQCLPPRALAGQPTTIVLTRDLADYKDLVQARRGNFLNPAFYDVERNQIVCGSELERLADALEKIRKAHARILTEQEERKAELNELYKGKIPAELVAAFAEDQKRIKAQEEQNNLLFKQARQRLFQRLYHEAFHAYLANFVYPPADAPVPRWLNEGLAQIFETAIFEAGELRVGHVEKDRCETIRTAVTRGTLPPLTELLRSEERAFLVAHAGEKQASDRMYLASWALAHYLTFERKILGTPAMTKYIQNLKRGTDPLAAFSELVGQPLPRFEKEFQDYLGRLWLDGSGGR